MAKQQINLVNVKELLKGRKFSEIPEEEQREIARLTLKQIQPPSQEQSTKKILYISITLSIVVAVMEISYLGDSSLALVILMLAIAIGLQGYYLIRKEK